MFVQFQLGRSILKKTTNDKDISNLTKNERIRAIHRSSIYNSDTLGEHTKTYTPKISDLGNATGGPGLGFNEYKCGFCASKGYHNNEFGCHLARKCPLLQSEQCSKCFGFGHTRQYCCIQADKRCIQVDKHSNRTDKYRTDKYRTDKLIEFSKKKSKKMKESYDMVMREDQYNIDLYLLAKDKENEEQLDMIEFLLENSEDSALDIAYDLNTFKPHIQTTTLYHTQTV